jgi:D-glycero-D-manno-heptose 1,7-bisphosphate phosphatase
MNKVEIEDISCLFLDRDGVINVDNGYVHEEKHFVLCDGIIDLIRSFNLLHIPVVIVTNQAGIGRGYYSLNTYLQFQNWVEKYLSKKDCNIARTYYSPYHPQAKIERFKKDSWLRKPGPGMFYKAKFELGINLSKSVLIGDKVTDIEAADAAGVGLKFLFSPSEQNVYHSNYNGNLIHHLSSVPTYFNINR